MELPRVLGIDPASKNAGLAVVEGINLLYSHQLVIPKRSTESEALADSLKFFWEKIQEACGAWEPTLIVVEHTSYPRNLNTTKLLTYYEDMAILVAAQNKCLIERVRTKQARKAVLGSGTFEKADIVQEMYQRYSKWLGPDEAEAVVFALYGYSLLNPESS